MAAGLGYLFGSLPWGLWLGLWFRGVDVRTVGSKNLGATNVYRALGPALGIATLLLDIAKGALPVWLVTRIVPGAADPGLAEGARVAAGLGAVAGHVWTFLAGFKGGKGVATTVGVLLALAPVAFAIFAVVFVATVAATGYVSLGSTFGAIAFALALAMLHPRGALGATFWLGLVLAGLILWRHRENYRRLLKGEERRFSFKGGSRT
jgi:glycerol-3-phosphate acyltransferase PlsY